MSEVGKIYKITKQFTIVVATFAASFYTNALATVPVQDPVRFVFLVLCIAFATLTILQIIMNLKKVVIKN